MASKRIDLKQALGDRVIDELRRVFYESSDMIITFTPLSGKGKVDFYPEKERSAFCRLVQSAPEGKSRCSKCEKSAARKAAGTKTPVVYTCHAGLTDVVVPLIFEDKFVGSLLSGQILTSKPTLSGFGKIWEKTHDLGLEKTALRKAYMKVRVFPQRKLERGVSLLSLIANYILEKEATVHFQEEIIAYQKRVLAESEKRKKLRKELKRALPFLRLETLSEKDMSRRERIIAEAKHFIENNYSEPLSLHIVSESVFLSPNYLSSLFKEYTGFTFRDYLANVRIEKAKELLENINIRVAEISGKSGFDDPNYFSRVFKRITGFNPSEYRRKMASR